MKFRRISPFPPAAFLGVFLSLAAGLPADQFTWRGSSDSNWFNDGNWTRSNNGSASISRRIDSRYSVVLSGGIAMEYRLDLRGGLRIDGAAAPAGYRGSIDQTGGNLSIVAGGFADSRSDVIQDLDMGAILVTGFAPDGRRSTLEAGLLRAGAHSSSAQEIRVENGGLLQADRIFLSFGPSYSGSVSSLTVSGVNANGTPSTVEAGEIWGGRLPVARGILAIEGGGVVGIRNGAYFYRDSTITVSGTAPGGQRSSLLLAESGVSLDRNTVMSVSGAGLVEGRYISGGALDVSGGASTVDVGSLNGVRLHVSDGGLVRADELHLDFTGAASITGALEGKGTLEIGSFGGSADNTISINGGVLRLTGNGEAAMEGSTAGIEIGGRGMEIDIPGEVVLGGAVLSGTGKLLKLGAGSLELGAGNSYTGNTVVAEGTLILTNSTGSATGSGDVRVAGGGALRGTGFLAGSLFSAGIVAPGNSPGTLHLGGDFRQKSSGTLAMEIVSPSQHDILQAGGNIHLAGDLRIDSSGPLEIGDRYRLIEAGGEIRGHFESILLGAGRATRGNFVTDGGSGFLLIAPASYTQVAGSESEASLALALDSWTGSRDPDEAAVVAALDSLPAAGYAAAFSGISPSLYQAGLDAALEQSQNQLAVLSQRLSSRQLQRGLPADGKRWETWAISSGIYSGNTLSSVSGDEFYSGSFLTGLEMAVNPALSLGILAGSSESRGSFPGSSDIEIERAVLGAYAAWSQGGFHASSSLGGGRIDLDVDRAIGFGGLSREGSSDTDGTEFFAHAAGGYDFRIGNWAFGPQAGLQYSRVDFDDVSESGAGALDLRVRGVEMDSLRSRLGGRVAYFQALGGGLTLIPESRLFWQHEFLRGNQNLDATLRNGGGPSFAWHSAGADADSVIGGVALGLQTGFGLYGNVAYDIELGREGDAIQYISLGADWKF